MYICVWWVVEYVEHARSMSEVGNKMDADKDVEKQRL